MHLFGGIYRLFPTFYTSTYVWFANTIVSSLAAVRTINIWRDIFLRVMSPSLPARAEVLYNKYLHIYVVYCLFWSCILCTAQQRYAGWTSKKSQWRRCSIQNVRTYDLICSNGLQSYLYCTKITFWTDRSFAWHQVLGLKSRSDNSKLNILTILKLSKS